MINVCNVLLKLKLKNPDIKQQVEDFIYKINISKDPDQYGNGCHMSVVNVETNQIYNENDIIINTDIRNATRLLLISEKQIVI